MKSDEIRSRFLEFFKARGHKIIPSSSLIPENDPSVLFTTAGMQQFKKYYLNPELAEKDFGTKNVVSVQKCVRTSDIDEVGDNSHLTFFEMLGNFSFGGYGRKEAIEYAYEFITKEMGLEISYVTVYSGSRKWLIFKKVPRDRQSEEIWQSLGIQDIRKEKSDVFWGPTGDSGPCGPTTEIYCKNASGEDVEIWNIVFNEYLCNGSREKLDKGEAQLEKLPVLGVDTGMGFERLVATVQKKKSVYDTDLFNNESTKEERIVADHLRASEFLIKDGVLPSNTGAGYVLRRLIRRAVRFSKESLNTKNEEIKKEENKFKETLENGIKEIHRLEKINKNIDGVGYITGAQASSVFSSFGVPLEITKEITRIKDEEHFYKKMAEHQKLSQTASAGMFKGGLADVGEESTKYHTATHLLLAALREILGKDIVQKGSNITAERMRFDFNWPEKVPADKLQEVENLVNLKIKEAIPVEMQELPKEEAIKVVKNLSFDSTKYGDIVKIYKIGDFSAEFCGGPHVENTGELGHFKILKEEASSAGIRRIKAVLE